jgi:hypothetical protein
MFHCVHTYIFKCHVNYNWLKSHLRACGVSGIHWFYNQNKEKREFVFTLSGLKPDKKNQAESLLCLIDYGKGSVSAVLPLMKYIYLYMLKPRS